MSGHKYATVTISEEEYRRLHEEDMKRRFRTSKKKEPAKPETADLTHALRDIEQRQRQFAQVLMDLDQDLDSTNAEMRQDLLEQNALYYQHLSEMIQEASSHADASLSVLSQHFANEMQRAQDDYQVQLQSLLQRLTTEDLREQSKAEAARQWLAQSAALSDLLADQFDHERFLPGSLSRIANSLSLAQTNFAQGFYESSLQGSQQAFLQLSELQAELEKRTLEWNVEYQKAHSALRQLLAELERNAQIPAMGLEGEELPEQIDLPYWSNGKYQGLLDTCRQLFALLSEEQRSIDELKRTSDELPRVVMDRFESIIYEARLNVLNSQLRMNIAERALQALEIQGFRLHRAGYTDQDMRAAFTAHLENIEGSQVKIEVLPADQPAQELTNQLVMITEHASLKTEQEARLQWAELCRSLNAYDLHVSRPIIRDRQSIRITDAEAMPSATTESFNPSKKQHYV